MYQKNKIKVVTIGRFHHFHLARQLSKYNLLDCIYSGYPKFKLKNEKNIIPNQIISYSVYVILHRLADKYLKKFFPDFVHYLNYFSHKKLSLFVKKNINFSKIIISSSGSGLEAGREIKKKNKGIFICDRGSSHILYQKRILAKEYKKFNLNFNEMYNPSINRELEEYKIADLISVPSKFVFNSFIKMGINKKKIFLNPYGVDLKIFNPTKVKKEKNFTVLYVGNISIRKGVIYLLNAFKRLKVKNKKLIIIGKIEKNIKSLIEKYLDDDKIIKISYVKNSQLRKYYSSANVFVQPSLEEGLSLVIGEALACGCPIIATKNTGAEDLFKNGTAGFIIDSGSSKQIYDKLNLISRNKLIEEKFSRNALKIVNKINGWDAYGKRWNDKLAKMRI